MKRITEYTNIGTIAETDVIPIVDVSDTEQASTGSTRKGTIATIADYIKDRAETLTNKILTTARLNTPKINEDVAVTATSTELNQLDGKTVGGTASGDIATIDGTQTLTNKTLDGDVNTLQDIKSESLKMTVGCRVYLGADQSITNGAWTKVNLGTESFDTGSDYDTSNYRFVAPVSGYYQVSIFYEWNDVADQAGVYASIYVNGSEYATQMTRNSGASDPGSVVSSLVYCASGQYIEAYAYNSDTVARSIKGVSPRSFMTIYLIGVA